MVTNFNKKIVGLLLMALFISNSAMAGGGLGKVIGERKLNPIKEGTASGNTGVIKNQIDPKVEELDLSIDSVTKKSLSSLSRKGIKYGKAEIKIEDILTAAKAKVEKNPDSKAEVENMLKLVSLAENISSDGLSAYIGDVVHMALKSEKPEVLEKVSKECQLIFDAQMKSGDPTMIEVEMVRVFSENGTKNGQEKLNKIKEGCKK